MNAAAGSLNYFNPFYWFYWMHLKAFNLLSAGFSRSREFLADRRAAVAYGKQAFIGGPTKVTVDGGLYEATAYQNVRWLLSNQQMFANVFEAYRGGRARTWFRSGTLCSSRLNWGKRVGLTLTPTSRSGWQPSSSFPTNEWRPRPIPPRLC